MSRELLREAAALMRERAEVAGTTTLHRPWASDGEQVTGGDGQWMLVATTADVVSGGDPESPTAEHIASWHPAVAVAVADLLEVIARDVGTASFAFHAATDFAHTYLGRQA